VGQEITELEEKGTKKVPYLSSGRGESQAVQLPDYISEEAIVEPTGNYGIGREVEKKKAQSSVPAEMNLKPFTSQTTSPTRR
jgi:hypothetical protein